METKAIFGILSSLFVIFGALPYLRDIYHRKIRPHLLSWIGWAFVTALGGSAMLAGGSQWAVAIVFANATACLLVVLFSLYRKVGIWHTTKFDYFFLGLGIIGLVLWQTLNIPVLALIFAILADFSFGIPTIIKTYKKPNSETWFPWFLMVLSGIFSLFAIRNFSFIESAYPIFLLSFDSTIFVLALRIFLSKNNLKKDIS